MSMCFEGVLNVRQDRSKIFTTCSKHSNRQFFLSNILEAILPPLYLSRLILGWKSEKLLYNLGLDTKMLNKDDERVTRNDRSS